MVFRPDEWSTYRGPQIGTGDGIVMLGDGSLRWGRFGSAGVLIRHVDEQGAISYFVAERSPSIPRGGTWAIPGGALNLGETPLEGALREFREEIGHDLERFEIADVYEDDQGGWSYWTVVVEVAERFSAREDLPWETSAVRWVSVEELAELELLEPFRETLHHLGIL